MLTPGEDGHRLIGDPALALCARTADVVGVYGDDARRSWTQPIRPPIVLADVDGLAGVAPRMVTLARPGDGAPPHRARFGSRSRPTGAQRACTQRSSSDRAAAVDAAAGNGRSDEPLGLRGPTRTRSATRSSATQPPAAPATGAPVGEHGPRLGPACAGVIRGRDRTRAAGAGALAARRGRGGGGRPRRPVGRARRPSPDGRAAAAQSCRTTVARPPGLPRACRVAVLPLARSAAPTSNVRVSPSRRPSTS
jgi:hypothetical protein